MVFPSTRIYNDVEVVHIRMQIDDSDEISETFLSQRVESPIRLISFRVELLHASTKYNGEVAKLTRSLIENGSSALVEDVDIVPFNVATKSFLYMVTNPEPGYSYKLSWPRPQLNGARNGIKRPKQKTAHSP